MEKISDKSTSWEFLFVSEECNRSCHQTCFAVCNTCPLDEEWIFPEIRGYLLFSWKDRQEYWDQKAKEFSETLSPIIKQIVHQQKVCEELAHEENNEVFISLESDNIIDFLKKHNSYSWMSEEESLDPMIQDHLKHKPALYFMSFSFWNFLHQSEKLQNILEPALSVQISGIRQLEQNPFGVSIVKKQSGPETDE